MDWIQTVTLETYVAFLSAISDKYRCGARWKRRKHKENEDQREKNHLFLLIQKAGLLLWQEGRHDNLYLPSVCVCVCVCVCVERALRLSVWLHSYRPHSSPCVQPATYHSIFPSRQHRQHKAARFVSERTRCWRVVDSIMMYSMMKCVVTLFYNVTQIWITTHL